jgi:cytochrome c oxidase subunit 2
VVRRGQLFLLVAVGAIYGGIAAAVALLIPWLPDPAARQAGRIDFVFWFTTVIAIVVFAVVAAVLTVEVITMRARPGDDLDGPPTHGHTKLEIVWTAIPAVLVTAISIVSAVVLSQNSNAGSDPLRVEVVAQQFAWTFKYPSEGNLTAAELFLPINRKVKLTMTSVDVIHSFWVPEFGQKQDLPPGIHPTLVITPDRIGTYPLICTELCGLGHAVMRTSAVVLSEKDFDAWVKKTKAGLAGPPGQAGKTVYNNNGCGSCHTLTAAGSTGKVGPNLDHLVAEAKTAGQALEPFIRQSIVEPNAYIAPGYPANVMPKTFGQLPPDQLDALVKFLVTSAEEAAK